MTTLSPAGKHALDNLIAQTAAANTIPGFVLGVSNIDEEIYFQGGGHNVVGDPSSGEVGPDSIMLICSQSKLVTSLAALKLVEQGKITFDTAVGDYLPEFRNPIIVENTSTEKPSFKPAQTVVTLKHLLNFTSGLFRPDQSDKHTGMSKVHITGEIHQSADPASEFFRVLMGDFPALPLKFEPGTDFTYGYSADATGFLVEKVSGQTLEQFCKEHIFDPLGMKASFFLTPDLKERAVDLAYRDENGTLHPWANQIEILEQDPTKVRALFGGTGLYSSMRDYLKLFRHLMQIHAGRQVPKAILKSETVHKLFVPALPEKAAKSFVEFSRIEGTSWSTGVGVSTIDLASGLRKGSIFWAGWAGTCGYINPTTGIASVFGTQETRGQEDIQVLKVMGKLDKTVYEGLVVGA